MEEALPPQRSGCTRTTSPKELKVLHQELGISSYAVPKTG